MLIAAYGLGINTKCRLKKLPLFKQIDVKLLEMVSTFQSFSEKMEIAFYPSSTNWILLSLIFAFKRSARRQFLIP